jgi:hypothetical protein
MMMTEQNFCIVRAVWQLFPAQGFMEYLAFVEEEMGVSRERSLS